MSLDKRITEAEVIAALRLDENKDGTPRKHPHRALYKLIQAGQRVKGRRVKLRAEQVGGRLLFREEEVNNFLSAVVVG